MRLVASSMSQLARAEILLAAKVSISRSENVELCGVGGGQEVTIAKSGTAFLLGSANVMSREKSPQGPGSAVVE
jgi:hypothetical protein